MPCSYFSAQPSACASYSIAWTSCPVACGACAPPPPGPSGIKVLAGAVTSDHPVAGLHPMQMVVSHRRELQQTTTVTTVAGLRAALANTAIAHIVLGDGTYILNISTTTRSGLDITRSVILEAAAGATVTLNAQASGTTSTTNGPAARRVLYINPGSTGYVQLIGLRITGGYLSCDGLCTPNNGGGVYIETGTVTMSSCSVYGNRVRQGVRATETREFPIALVPGCSHVLICACACTGGWRLYQLKRSPRHIFVLLHLRQLRQMGRRCLC